MARKVRIPLGDGNEVEAVEQDFQIIKEDWNEYELADGGRIRAKTIVVKILRVLDPSGKPALTPEGDPQVIVRHKTEVVSRS